MGAGTDCTDRPKMPSCPQLPCRSHACCGGTLHLQPAPNKPSCCSLGLHVVRGARGITAQLAHSFNRYRCKAKFVKTPAGFVMGHGLG